MQQYGNTLPFNNKKSGFWSDFYKHESPKPRGEGKKRQRRWLKRIARRVGKKVAQEQLTECQPKNTHF